MQAAGKSCRRITIVNERAMANRCIGMTVDTATVLVAAVCRGTMRERDAVDHAPRRTVIDRETAPGVMSVDIDRLGLIGMERQIL